MDLSTISANTLFHFTNSLQNLISILTNEFYPRYSLEDLRMYFPEEFKARDIRERAIPMVCFCDIPLSQIRNYITYYGTYALGLSKNWGGKHGINPIMYSLPNSNSTNFIKESFRKIIENGIDKKDNNISDELESLFINLDSFINYTKPYEGKLWRDGKFTDYEVQFYNEREWRFVPRREDINSEDFRPFLLKDEFTNSKIRRRQNKIIERSYSLSFEPNDIRYIIVKKEKEISNMIYQIKEIKQKYSQTEINLLITKIISLEQILNDF